MRISRAMSRPGCSIVAALPVFGGTHTGLAPASMDPTMTAAAGRVIRCLSGSTFPAW